MWLTDQISLFRLAAFIVKAGQSFGWEICVNFYPRKTTVPKEELVLFYWDINLRVLQRRLIFLISLFKPLKSDIEV